MKEKHTNLQTLLLPIFLVLSLLFLSACTDNPISQLKLVKTTDLTDPKTLHGDSWQALFEEFWTVMNQDYVHFADEQTDWDAVYKNYAPKFKDLDYYNQEDSFKAFGLLKEIVWNLSDYHYHLTIEDSFGYTLDARPAVLQKWVALGKDIADFPDIYTVKKVKGKKVKTYYTVKGGPNKSYDATTCRPIWNQAINGYSEVEELKAANAFHKPASTVASTFYEFYPETFGETTITKQGNWAWDSFIVDTFEMEGISWCTGLTKSGVLYIYFSQFVDVDLIHFCNYMANKDSMSEAEKEAAKANFKAGVLHAISVYETRINKEAKAQIDVIIKLFKNLNNAVTDREITLADGTKQEVYGIVLDLRCNGGGSADFMQLFMSTFFASDKTVGYNRYKMGFSRYDYTPWTEFKLNNYNKNLKEDYQGRFAVITNGRSISCSELSTITSKLLPNSLRFGSTTYGATCALTSRDEYQSGTYENDNLTVRTTTFRYKAFDQTSYESHGIEPDVPVALNTTQDDRFMAAVKWAATGTF